MYLIPRESSANVKSSPQLHLGSPTPGEWMTAQDSLNEVHTLLLSWRLTLFVMILSCRCPSCYIKARRKQCKRGRSTTKWSCRFWQELQVAAPPLQSVSHWTSSPLDGTLISFRKWLPIWILDPWSWQLYVPDNCVLLELCIILAAKAKSPHWWAFN